MDVEGSSALKKCTSGNEMFYILGTIDCMDSVELLAYIMAGGRLLCGVTGSIKSSVQLCACWRKAVMSLNLPVPCVL